MDALTSVVAWLDETLNTRGVIDYPGAENGLQLENAGEVNAIAAAVDACEPVVLEAAKQGIGLLIVHHGLFWQRGRFTGSLYRKLRAATASNVAIYSSHLPLDLHHEYGNNVQLAKALGFSGGEPAFRYQGQPVGLKVTAAVRLAELTDRLEAVLGARPHACLAGPPVARQIGILTGAGGSEVAQAVAEGVDTFITGEGPHWSYTLAEELKVNIFYGGHYRTETFGVKALAAAAAAKFSLRWTFLDHPTGL